MTDDTNVRTFRLAPMSPFFFGATLVLLALPVVCVAGFLFGKQYLAVPGLLIIALYVWVWLRFRPKQFVVHPGGVQIVWPLKRRDMPKKDIMSARVIGRRELIKTVGLGFRIGVGGLWGAFGLLWTTRRGLVRMYVSRSDWFVWIECANGKPWLITPENPNEFVRALVR